MAFDQSRLSGKSLAAKSAAFKNVSVKSLAVSAASLLLIGCWNVLPAGAAEDTNTFNSFLGFFGMQFDKEKDEIDYRARAPLVIPPKMDLPAPRAADAHRPADWPSDPDINARRKALVDMSNPDGPGGRSVTVEEPKGDSCSAFGGSSFCIGSPWQYVTEKMGIAPKSDGNVVLTGEEPPRKYLTEPPPGYRIPSAQTAAVREKPKSEDDAADAQAYTRKEQAHKHSVDDQQ
jgi:hypothetical protein